MLRLLPTLIGAISVAVAGVGSAIASHPDDAPASQTPPSAHAALTRTLADTAEKHASDESPTGGLAAIEQAAKANKYLFALCWKEEDESTSTMRKTLSAAMKKASDRAVSAKINVADRKEKPIVDKFQLDFAPMPLLLVIAPNGVVTAGFATKVEEKELLNAFATPATEKCLKALEDNKLVLLCIQNAKTKSNEEALKGVREFAQDERFAESTEIVIVDPADTAEAKLLTDLEIDPGTKQAITVFLAPPGRHIGIFQGATNQDELVQSLVASMSGFG